MSAEAISNLDRPEVRQATLRSLVYGVFAAAVEYPDSEMLETIRSGLIAQRLSELLTEIDAELTADANWDALADAGEEQDSIQIEYTRLFDVGQSGTPPCSLAGGTYTDARLKTMEELVRFYNHFGFSMVDSEQDVPMEHPDHLAVQLEFLHVLTFQEAGKLEENDDPAPYQRAQRDFVHRHPARWIPQLRETLETEESPPYLTELFRLLDTFLRHEDQQLHARLGTLQYTNS
jgi:DMSO reductase family type II enzyme chaperone